MVDLEAYEYFEKKKRDGLILTAKNMNPDAPLICMKDYSQPIPFTNPYGPDYWSRKSSRYRTKQEQLEFIENDCVDTDLGEIPDDWCK